MAEIQIKRTVFVKKTQSIRDSMINHIHAINKHLTKAYLENFTTPALFGECHPQDRADYEKEYYNPKR